MKTIVDFFATLAVIRSTPRLLSSLLFLRPLRLHVFGVLRPSSFFVQRSRPRTEVFAETQAKKQIGDDVALVLLN